MKKNLLLIGCSLLVLTTSISAQSLEPFENCPGVSVAVTRPGTNMTLLPHQIYLIDSTGAIQPIGEPINNQINGFGLNSTDGFLYAMYEAFNVATPYLARVDKNGRVKNIGLLTTPAVSTYKVGFINTAAGTMDDRDNYYFTAAVIDLQNILVPPELYVGKVEHVSLRSESTNSLPVVYKRIELGNCLDAFLTAFSNPLNGILQDIAFNSADRNIYTFFPTAGTGGSKIARFNPDSPVFTCLDAPQPNTTTEDLSGLFFGGDTLFILTIDGKYYKADVATGTVDFIAQTTLPLLNGNLRGDMASCLTRDTTTGPLPFAGCPGAALAITRPGINATMLAHQIYEITAEGAVTAIGNPIDMQINAFGLNNRDGFLYGMHEVSNVFSPLFSRVDATGTVVDIGTLMPPAPRGGRIGIINTAAATMDGNDNYYFTALLVDTLNSMSIPRLYYGVIRGVSQLQPGDSIRVQYRRIFIGSCIEEIIGSLSSQGTGLFQDIVYNPLNGRIYTYIQASASPAPGKLASFRPTSQFPLLNCLIPDEPNIATQDLSGMYADQLGRIFILTIDGKYYRANPNNGEITLLGQTALPLLDDNLRGDMASCLTSPLQNPGKEDKDHHFFSYEDDSYDDAVYLRVAPNPVRGSNMIVHIHADEKAVAELHVLDENGTSLQTKKIFLIKGDNQFRIDLPFTQKRGMYALAVIYPSGRTRVVKFIRL